MEFTVEEFQQTDEAWLAENLFEQLKDINEEKPTITKICNINFNNNIIYVVNEENKENKENNKLVYHMPLLEQSNDIIVKNLNEFVEDEFSQDIIEETSQEDSVYSYDCDGGGEINYDNQEIIIVPVKRTETSSDGAECYEIMMDNNSESELSSSLCSDNVFQIQDEIQIPGTPIPIVSSACNSSPTPPILTEQTPIFKCENCDQIYDENAFTEHVCEFDSNKNAIIVDTTSTEEIQISEDSIKNAMKENLILQIKENFSNEPPCIKQYNENNIKLRKFLKKEFRIDIPCSGPKKDGPHECTLCERKFVHASGLARHMEKHALDLIPSTNNTASESKANLKVLVKCLICGRVFYFRQIAIDHVLTKHQESPNDSKEISCIDQSKSKNDSIKNFIIKKINGRNYKIYKNPQLQSVEKAIQKMDFPNEIKKKESQPPENVNVDTLNVVENDNPEENENSLKIVILSCVLNCEYCDYMFSDVASLLRHSATHNPFRRFECKSCEISLKTAKEMFLHWQAECSFSKELFRNDCNLQKYYVCNVCENKFTTLEQLFEHRYTVMHLFPRECHVKMMKKMILCCEYCGIVFDTASDIFKHHEEKHFKKVLKKEPPNSTSGGTKYRQYLCDVCGKSYTQSSHLWQHLRFHRGVKPFACKETGCNRKFTIRPDLNDHIRKCHTGERPYHCLVCGKRFLTGSVFYQHRLIHRGERRYGCEQCGKRFYRADALKNHQRIHTGEKPYACTYCCKNFRQRGDRDKHIRARHSNLDENARNLLASIKNSATIQNTLSITTTANAIATATKKSYSHSTITGTTKNNGLKEKNGVFYVGAVPFPASMFKPVITDIDG